MSASMSLCRWSWTSKRSQRAATSSGRMDTRPLPVSIRLMRVVEVRRCAATSSVFKPLAVRRRRISAPELRRLIVGQAQQPRHHPLRHHRQVRPHPAGPRSQPDLDLHPDQLTPQEDDRPTVVFEDTKSSKTTVGKHWAGS